MTRPLLLCAALMLASTVPACAPAHQSSTATPDGATAPKVIGNDHPEVVMGRGTGDMRVEYRVMVDPDGHPDMSTLRFSGSGTAAASGPISDWLSHTTFEPGRLNGVPVRAEYRGTVESRAARR